MQKIIKFDEAIEATDGEDRALLIGNGFSAQYFDYQSLLEKSGLDDGTPLRTLFDDLDTVDFEVVVRALEGAVVDENAYGNTTRAKELDDDAQKVHEALIYSITDTHPKNRDDLCFQYTRSAAFLRNFSTVFTLNYDLLLYWVILEKKTRSDG